MEWDYIRTEVILELLKLFIQIYVCKCLEIGWSREGVLKLQLY